MGPGSSSPGAILLGVLIQGQMHWQQMCLRPWARLAEILKVLTCLQMRKCPRGAHQTSLFECALVQIHSKLIRMIVLLHLRPRLIAFDTNINHLTILPKTHLENNFHHFFQTLWNRRWKTQVAGGLVFSAQTSRNLARWSYEDCSVPLCENNCSSDPFVQKGVCVEAGNCGRSKGLLGTA